VCAAASWGIGNLMSRALSRHSVNALAFVVWSALLATLPFLGLALLFEGTAAVRASFAAMTLRSWAAALYLALGATVHGYGLWNRLLKLYPAALVTRFALLVPVIALFCGSLLLGEQVSPAQAAASALVVAGVALPLAAAFWARFFFEG